MKTLSRRTALAAVPALAVVPVLAALVPLIDAPLDTTPEPTYWDQIADGIERKWRSGKLAKALPRLRAIDGLAEFANALEDTWRAGKMPEALTAMRAEHYRLTAIGLGEGGQL